MFLVGGQGGGPGAGAKLHMYPDDCPHQCLSGKNPFGHELHDVAGSQQSSAWHLCPELQTVGVGVGGVNGCAAAKASMAKPK